jgi:hypothetical protein
MAFNLNGFNFNQSVVDSQGRVINTWHAGTVVGKLEGDRESTLGFVDLLRGKMVLLFICLFHHP